MGNSTTDNWQALVAMMRLAPPDQLLAVHNKAARMVADMEERDALPEGVQPLNIALLRSTTAEVLENSIVACLAEASFAASLSMGVLGNIAQEVWNDDSFLYTHPFDACIVLPTAEQVLPGLLDLSAPADLEDAVDSFVAQIECVADRFKGLVLLCNLALPRFIITPHLQAQTPSGGRYAVAHANRRLAEAAAKRANVVICDLESLVARMGTERFYSARDMMTALQPFGAAAITALAQQLADLYTLYKTAPVKCIVLDCDNTLWGGIVGEDGLSGIQLGETYPGLCFQQFQRQLGELNRLGFLLALNSRNNEADVKQVFDEHPAVLLKWDQLAATRVNWQDKAANMREIAAELNIGLDSIVFIDDSDFEIDLVRDQLPEVRCLRVPPQPWALPGLLGEAQMIDRVSVTAEDRKKAEMYTQERRRREFKHETGNLEDYLRGLDIRLKFERFEPELHLSRTAQLTQKTNQFNLTTRRYTEADIARLAEQEADIFLATLQDRFGDYGRIALAVVIPGAAPKSCRLDVFLLSCRVIGRGVEGSFLRLVLAEMKRAGFEKIQAEFIPTAKNVVCRDFLPKNDFVETGRSADDHVQYESDLRTDLPPVDNWITLF